MSVKTVAQRIWMVTSPEWPGLEGLGYTRKEAEKDFAAVVKIERRYKPLRQKPSRMEQRKRKR